MKKILLPLVILATLLSCGDGERGFLDYRGLSMGMKASDMADSLQKRGLTLDTVRTDSSHYVLTCQTEHYTVAIFQQNDTISDILEQYRASRNDSTTWLFQKLHDQLQEEMHQLPYMKYRADLHKEAVYDNKKGTVVLTLKNNNSPTLQVRYSTQTAHLK